MNIHVVNDASTATSIRLANPRGFCAGVDRAIDIVNSALDIFGAPIYVRHEVVHNKFVVDILRKRGAIFVDELSNIPIKDEHGRSSIVIFSAHGVSIAVKDEARAKGYKIFDATCPLVTKVHLEVTKFSQEGRECVLIGHQFHPEVEGTMGQINDKNKIKLVQNQSDVESLEVNQTEKICYVTQTTLSIDETKEIIKKLKEKYPHITGPNKSDICYATQNRQDAIKTLLKNNELVIVVGSSNSSNSNRLADLASQAGVESILVGNIDKFDLSILENKKRVAITAGASAPEILVKDLIKKIKMNYDVLIDEMNGIEENVVFKLPTI